MATDYDLEYGRCWLEMCCNNNSPAAQAIDAHIVHLEQENDWLRHELEQTQAKIKALEGNAVRLRIIEPEDCTELGLR